MISQLYAVTANYSHLACIKEWCVCVAGHRQSFFHQCVPFIMPKLSLDQRGAIVALRDEGLSYEEIGKQVGCSKTATRLCYNKFKKTGSVTNRRRTGRPPKTDSRLDARIRRYSKSDRRLTAVGIQAFVPNANVSVRTVKRRPNAADLFGRAARKKPFLSKRHLSCRLAMDHGATELATRRLVQDRLER